MALKVGVLGYRFMGKAHSNAFARLPLFFPDAPDVERHTLVGRDEDALAEAADRFGFSHTATDWADAIDEVDVFSQPRAEPHPSRAVHRGARSRRSRLL